jgi:arylsulfatase A-like enzyme
MNGSAKNSSMVLKRILLFVFVGGFLFSRGQSTMNTKHPNIICILVDDLGYGDLSIQGATDMRTPNIDNLAKQGLTFTHFYANSTVCSPSRASLLSGRYPDLVGVPGVIRQNKNNSWGHLAEDATLIPSVLKVGGYHTAMIGKWHLGFDSPNTPNGKGFDYFKGFLGDMMDDYWTHLRGGVNWMRCNEEEINPEGHATDIFTDWAIDYLNEQKNEDKPFFLYLAYNAPHFPIQPPQEWLNKVREREPDISEKRAKNVALIEHLDDNIGRLIRVLKETNLDENTLVIFTSDNGGSLPHAQSNGKLRGGKLDMYEGGIRVPAFFYWKNKIEPGTITENFAMLMDLFPTFCELANVEHSNEIDGISILPTLLGEEQVTNNRCVFWVRRDGGYDVGGLAYYAARYKEYKILQNSPFEPFQFFNLKKDEYEKNPLNISGDEIYGKLRVQLQDHIRRAGAIPWQEKRE